MASNQATINVAVNVQKLSDVTGLRDAFASLRSVIINLQRANDQVASTSRKNAESAARIARTNAATQVQEARKVAVAEKSVADVAHRGAQTRLADARAAAVAVAAESKVRVDASRIERNNTLNQIALDRDKRNQERQAAQDASKARKEQEQKDTALLRLQQRANELNAKHQAQLEDERKKQAMLKATIKDRLAYYEKALDAIFRAGYRLKQVGQDLQQFGMGIIGTMKGLTDAFGEFEFMAGRAAGAIGDWAIGGGEADKNFRALQDTILANAESMRLFTATDVAKSLYFLASTTGQVVDSQQDLDNMMRSLEPIMQTAALTQTDYETTIKGVYSIVTQYNSELVRFSQQSGNYTRMSEEMRKVTIDLFYVAQKTAAEFNDLVNSFKMVGPVAKQSGASFEDILDLIGRLADVGIRGTMAGRALRQMFIQMVKPSGPATAALNQLFSAEKNVVEFGGKNYKQLMFPDGQFVGTTKYINILARALQGATQQQKNYLLARISTANELPVLQALIAQETAVLQNGGEALSKTADMNTKAQETFTKAWERLRGSWVGTVSALQRGVESLQIVIGRELANAFKPFIDKVREIVDALRSWVQANPQLVAEIGKFLGVAAGISVVAGAIISATGAIIGMVAAASLIIGAFAPAIPIISALVTLVAAFGAAVIDRFDEIQLSLQSFASEISRTFNVLTTSTGDGESALQSIFEMFKIVADQFINVGKTIIDTITAIVKALNDLGLTVPIVKLLGVAMAFAFGKSILNNIKNLILSTRLFRKEMETTWSVQTVTAANGVTTAMLSQAVVTKELGAGYRIAAAASEALRSVTLATSITFPKLAAVAIPAITGIGKAIGTAASFALGPYGIIAAFAAMTAFDMNLFGIRDAIEGISGSTRNLKEELNAANTALGDFALRSTNAIEQSLVPGFETLLSRVNGLTAVEQKIGETLSGTDVNRKVLEITAWGQTFSEVVDHSIFGDDIKSAQDRLRQRLTEFHDRAIADAMTFITDTKDGLNQLIVSKGGEPIDPNKIIETVLGLSEKTGVSPDRILSAYKSTIERFGMDFSFEELKSFAAPFGEQAASTIAAGLYDPSVIESATSSAFAKKRIDAQKAMYQPLIDALTRAMKAGDQKSVSRLLAQPLQTMIGGVLVDTGPAIAELPSTLIDQLGWSQLVQDAFTGLDSALAAAIGDGIAFGEDSETALKLSDQVTMALAADFDAAHSKIMLEADDLLYKFINGIDNSIIGIPAPVDESRRRDRYRMIANMIVDPKTGERVVDYIRSNKSLEGVVGPELGTYFTQIVNQGIQEGYLTAAETSIVKVDEKAARRLADRIAGPNGIKGFGAYLVPSSELVSGISSSLDKSLTILYPEINRFASNTLDAFALSLKNAKTPQQIKDAYAWLFSQSFNGQTVIDVARSENVDGDIRSGFKQVIEGAASAGIVDKTVLDAFNASGSEDGKKTWGEYVDSFTSAVESARSFKERLKEALKAGGTGKQIGSLLKTFASRDIRRALKGNLTARGLGVSELGISAEGLISSLVAVKPGQQKKFASKIARFFILRGADMPPEAKNAFQPVIDFLINNTNIKDQQKSDLGKLITDPVTSGATITQEQANTVGTEILNSVATGIQNASSNEDVLTLVRTAHTNLLSTFTAAVDWKAEGINAGKAWAEGLSEGMKTFILGLTVVKDNTEGQSPPKKGPLKNIDKGGVAVGKAYGASLSKGMGTEVKSGLDKISAMARTWTGPKGNYRAGRSWTNPLDTLIAGRQWTTPAQNLSPWLMGRSWTTPARNNRASRTWTTPMDMLSPWIMGRSWTKGGPTAGRQWTTPAGFGPEKGRSWTNKPNVGPSPQGARTWTGAISLSWDKNSKKQIAIDITVKSDPNTPATAIGEIRRGIMEALTASDLEHMMEIT